MQIVEATTSAVDTAITAMRNTANDKWLMTAVGLQGEKVLIVNIEEA